VNHGICLVCGTLLKSFYSTCSVCGFEDLLDFDDLMLDESSLMKGTSDAFIQKELDHDLGEEDLWDRN